MAKNDYVLRKEFDELKVTVNNGFDELKGMLNQILNQDSESAPSDTEKSDEVIEEKKTMTKEERLTKKYGTLEERKSFVEYQNKIRAEFSKCYKDSKKTMVISPKSKYNKVVDTLANEFKSGEKKWSVKACKDAFKANAKKIER